MKNLIGFAIGLSFISTSLLAGGNISGGGDLEEQQISKLRDRIQKFILSPAFPREEFSEIDLVSLNRIISKAKINTVTKLPALRVNDKPRGLVNYWDANTPNIDVKISSSDLNDKSDFYSLNPADEDKIGIFFHEFLELTQTQQDREKQLAENGQVRLLDDNFLISNPLAQELKKFENDDISPIRLFNNKAKLMACYEMIYSRSEGQDYWLYSVSRAHGNPLDTEPEFVMIPTEDDQGLYFLSPHNKYATYSVSLRDKGGALIFLPDPAKQEADLMNMDGFVLSYFAASKTPRGETRNRYDFMGTNIEKFIVGPDLLGESFKQRLKEENFTKYKELEAAEGFDAFIAEEFKKFSELNSGLNLKTYKMQMLLQSVDEGLVLKNTQTVLSAFQNAIVKRIQSMPARKAAFDRHKQMDIDTVGQWAKEGSGGAKESLEFHRQLFTDEPGKIEKAKEICRNTGDPMIIQSIQETFEGAEPVKVLPASSVNSNPAIKDIENEQIKRQPAPKVSVEAPNFLAKPQRINPFNPPDRKGQKTLYSYAMPRGDSARQHDAWDDKKSMKFYIYRETAAKSEYRDIPLAFLARAEGETKILKMDVNCYRNSGGILLIKSSEQNEEDTMRTLIGSQNDGGPGIGFSIQGYWFGFHSKQACDEFADYLKKNSARISSENPIELTVDDNHFYRVVKINAY